MKDLTTWTSKLKDLGLKTTKHRIAILKLLENAKSPLSADSMYDEMKKTDILISLSTVYRALETLVENELVSKVQFENETKALYEINKASHHHHFICLGCNKIITLDECPVKDIEEKVSGDFEIIGHKLEFYGYCKDCQKRGYHS